MSSESTAACACGHEQIDHGEGGCDRCDCSETARTLEDECVCGEINTRHCPVHGQGDSKVVATTEREES